MQQQDPTKSPLFAPAQQDHAAADQLFQADYFHEELNASEDSAEWQEFARLQGKRFGKES